MVEQKYASVDEYIATFPSEVQEVLESVRRTIRDALPGSGETIRYHIPLVTLDGTGLFYFAVWKRHVSVYPAPAGDEALRLELVPYLSGASTLKFPVNEPVPHDLIRRVALQHVNER